ncbi:Poly [ADP-ribose] polymerase tankyrase, partial [Gryllus bimaculatus]
DAFCAELRAALGRGDAAALRVALRVALRGVAPGVRAAKLRQALERDFPGRWGYVDDAALSRFAPRTLEVVARTCRVFVLDLQRSSQRAAQLVHALQRDGVLAVELCGEKGTPLIPNAYSMDDNWTLAQLSDDAQEAILDSTVEFQGDALFLRELLPTWPQLLQEVDGALLGVLARGGGAALGAAPPAAEEGVSMERAVQHRSALAPAVLRLHSSTDHLALSGFPERMLQELGRALNVRDCTRNLWWTALGAGADRAAVKRLRHLGNNVHWIECVGGEALDEAVLEWRCSVGDPGAVARFVRPLTAECARAPECVHGAAWGVAGAAGLLVGEAGVGKSSLLRQAAADARRRAPASWAVFVEVLAHRDFLRRLPAPAELTLEHALELLAAAAGVAAPSCPGSDAPRRCLEAAVLHSGAISVFVDGVDEISPFFKDKVLKLLQLLQDVRMEVLWVSSRPEQERFLREHWGSVHARPAAEFAGLAAEVVGALRMSSPGLLDVLLHVKMAAEALAERAEAALRPGGGGAPWHQGWSSLSQLYHFFVEHKRAIFMERHGLTSANWENLSYTDEFQERHQMCAMYLMLSSGSYDDVDTSPFQEYIASKSELVTKEKTGIMWADESGLPRFVHFSFVEYFAAQWLAQNAASCAAQVVLRSLFAGRGSDFLAAMLERTLVERAGPGRVLPLHEAVLSGDDARLAEALAQARRSGADVDARDAGQRTALHLAAHRCLPGAVRQLLDAGCDPTRADALLSWTPLHYLDCSAAKHGGWKMDRMSVGEALVEAGAKPEALENLTSLFPPTYVYEDFDVPPDFPKMMLFSLRQGCTCRYLTALKFAVRLGFPKTTRCLLEAGMSACAGAVEGEEVSGDAGLRSRICSRGGDHQLAERFALKVAVPDLKILDCFPERFWESVCVHEKFASDFTALHCTIVTGKLRAAERLLERGADVRARTSDGFEPLQCALSSNSLLNEDTRLHAARLLMRYGADPNCGNLNDECSGNLTMNEAAHLCGEKVLELMVKNGGNIHSRNKDGRHPLFYAKDINTVSYLLESGIDPHIKDVEGQVALHSTSSFGLLSAVEALLPLYEVSITDNVGISPLHLAAGNGHTAVVNTLLSRTEHVDIVDCHGCTPLHFAAMKKLNIRYVEGAASVKRVISDEQLEVASLLLERGADPNKHTFAKVTPHDGGKKEGCGKSDNLLSVTHREYGDVARGSTPLHWAVSRGKMEMVQLLLKHNASINSVDKHGRTVLHLASQKCDPALIKLLLDEGADALALDSKKQAPLHYLFFWRTLFDNTFVYSLVKEKSDPYKLDEMSPHEDTRLPHEVARLLLENNANVEQKDAEGRSPLHLAMLRGDAEIVQVLLEHGANPQHLNDTREASLCFFIQSYCLDTSNIIHHMLEAGDDPNGLDEKGNAPLHHAARKGKLDEVNLILQYNANIEQKDAKGRTPLHLAIKYRHPDLITLFLDYGANPLELDNDQQEPLNYVLMSDICVNGLEERLLNVGANPNRIDIHGMSPLHHAMRQRQIEVVRLMLKHNAKVNLKDSEGCTALHYAMHSDWPLWEGYSPTISETGKYADVKRVDHELQLEIVKLLLDHDAEVDVKDGEGCTPLHLASRDCDLQVVKLLLDCHADPLTLDNKHQGPLNYLYKRRIWFGAENIPEVLLNAGANPHCLDEDGTSPLHQAARRNHLKAAKLFLMHKVNVDQRDNNGRTPLHLAIEKDHREMVELLLDHNANPLALDKWEQGSLNYIFKNKQWQTALVAILLNAGSDPNRLDQDGSAPLHHAVRRRDCEAVKLLLSHKACVNMKDAKGRSALHQAVTRNDPRNLMMLPIDVHIEESNIDSGRELEIVQLLLDHKAAVDDADAEGRTAIPESEFLNHEDTGHGDNAVEEVAIIIVRLLVAEL